MIPLDRVRAMLAAMRPSDLQELAREEPDWGDLCAEAAPVDLFIAAPDLARDVLTLAAALETAERERDAARSAHAELAAAVATVRDARAVVAATSAQYNAAWDAASAPPTPSDCEAVAAALRASYEAGDALSAALDALLARCP